MPEHHRFVNTLEHAQETVNKERLAKYSSIAGFISAFVGYTFHPFLWDSAFYHLISVGFVCYTLALRISSSGRWHWIPLICSFNSLVDEIRCKGFVFDWSEYVAFAIILLVIFTERKRAIQNIIGLLMKLRNL